MPRPRSAAAKLVARLFRKVTGDTQCFFTCRESSDVRVIPAELMGGKDDGLAVIIMEVNLRNREGEPIVSDAPLAFSLSIDAAMAIAERLTTLRIMPVKEEEDDGG